MCDTCGCTTELEQMSGAEQVKARSRRLRGTLAEELLENTPVFSDDAEVVLKFHGVYQQDDRDLRKEARRLGGDKHHMMMIRTRIPGGIVSPDAYLAHDRIAGEWGNGTLRVTTRQDLQLHGVLKGDLKRAIRAINDGLLTTLGGCGDQERNIMCCPAPWNDRLHADIHRSLSALVTGLTPTTRAYCEIWLDGDLAASNEPDPPDTLYGERYLPRKFKTAIATLGDNCVDIYANDLGLVAHATDAGALAGFDLLVGGGLGRTANKPNTWPAVAQPLGYVLPENVVAAARAVVAVQRDYGDRTDRRHARLKYLIHDRGIDWFRAEVQSRLPFALEPSRSLQWEAAGDHFGWFDQGDGTSCYGLFVENGRIHDTESGGVRSAVREIVETLHLELRLTPQQNIMFTNITVENRGVFTRILDRWGIVRSESLPNAVRDSMACPAYPTCGLAVAESERAMPTLIREIALVQRDAGVEDQRISYRMTGCPNGCARPYLGDVGFVGTTLGKYDVFLGGDFEGTRLSEPYMHNVKLEEIPRVLRGPLFEYASTRLPGEGFGDWCARNGISELAERHALLAVPA
ncbi:MAG: NADPH-dependent assimilatory sulfite reductase hemoprotein subunit [Candidatus Dormibacteria bacterium]|jgi:sulfite reductase (ferredoxin)